MSFRYIGLGSVILSLLLAPSAQAADGQWLAGDLHSHSTHSDGSSAIGELVAEAESLNLDYFVVTDHDSSTQGQTPHWDDPSYQSDQLILLYGIEWTNAAGHANIWATAPFDYSDIWAANLAGDPWEAADAARAQGALFSINHPTSFNCCPWDEAPDMSDAIEVWNGFHRTASFDWVGTRKVWMSQLDEGRAVTAVGGSDVHDLNELEDYIWGVANPTTWLFAESNTSQGVIDAIQAGKASVSYGPTAPRVELWADDDGDGIFETGMGESLTGGTKRLRVILGDNLGADGAVTSLPIEPFRRAFEGETRPIDLVRVGQALEAGPLGCGPSYLVGVYDTGRLTNVSRVDCGGGRFELSRQGEPGGRFRVEVMGVPTEATPIQHPVFGLFIALSNPIYVE